MPSPGSSLLEELRALHTRLRRSMRERYDRSLPLEELVFDRWERAADLGFGDRASIYHNAYVFGEVHAGADTWIGPMVMLDGSGGRVGIGEWCCISAGVHVYTHDTVQRSLTGGRAAASAAPVSIGDRTYVGAQVVVLPGVVIGDECVIGAGSLVNRDIPSHSIAVGTPARVVGEVAPSASGEQRELRWHSA